MMKNHVLGLIALAGLLCMPGLAAGQDMERVRALYIAASYEEALAAMPEGFSAAAGTELEQYRALCLLALGREAEAKTTIERLVMAHPLFVPPADEVSPRMRTLFANVRDTLVPAIARQAYADAKAAYEAKDREAARVAFQRTLDLIDSIPEDSRGSLEDMRMLATDFRDLTAARPAAVRSPSAAAETPGPVPPTVAPESAAPAGGFVPAVPLRQELPPWNPLDSGSRRTEYVGLLQVQIGPDGRVTLARMLKVSHPAYDVTVLREARRWLYKPATRGGVPVASEREIEIRLRPQLVPDDKTAGSGQ